MVKEISYSGETFTFSVKTNNIFTISVVGGFLRVRPSSGTGTRTITCSVDTNLSPTQRNGQIIVQLTEDECVGVTNTLDILQFGKEEEDEPTKYYDLTIKSNYNGNSIANGIIQPFARLGANNYSSVYTFEEGTNVKFTRSRKQDELPTVSKNGLTSSVQQIVWEPNDNSNKTITLQASVVTSSYDTFSTPGSGSVTMNSDQTVTLNLTATEHPEHIDTSVINGVTHVISPSSYGFVATKGRNGIYTITPPTNPQNEVTAVISFYLEGFQSVSVTLIKKVVKPKEKYTLTVYSNYSGTTTANNVTKNLDYRGSLNRYVAEYEYEEGTQVNVSRSHVNDETPTTAYTGINLSTNSIVFGANENEPRNFTATTTSKVSAYKTFVNPTSKQVTMNKDEDVYLDLAITNHKEETSTADTRNITFVNISDFSVTSIPSVGGLYKVTPPQDSFEQSSTNVVFSLEHYNNATLSLLKYAMNELEIDLKINNSESYIFSGLEATTYLQVYLYDSSHNIVRSPSILSGVYVSMPSIIQSVGARIYPQGASAPSFTQQVKAIGVGADETITASFTSGGTTFSDNVEATVQDTMSFHTGDEVQYIQVINGHSIEDKFDMIQIGCVISLWDGLNNYRITFTYDSHNNPSINAVIKKLVLVKNGVETELQNLNLQYDVTYNNVMTTDFSIIRVPTDCGISQEANYLYGGQKTSLFNGATILLKKGGFFQIFVCKE